MSVAETISFGAGLRIPGTPFVETVRTAETNGALVALSVEMPVGLTVPEHVHEHEDQLLIVISGTIGATVGDRSLLLEPGAVVLLPRGVPHSQWNAGDVPARQIDLYTPGGFEEVFRMAGRTGEMGMGPT